MMQLMMTGRRKKMTGKKMTNNNESIKTLPQLFKEQMINQDCMLMSGMYDGFKSEETMMVPTDDIKLSSYHTQQLISEIGEVLEADKRWKNFRNIKFDKEAKLEEIADCFIVLMNIAMFSGFNGFQLSEAIDKKIKMVSERIQEKTEEDKG